MYNFLKKKKKYLNYEFLIHQLRSKFQESSLSYPVQRTRIQERRKNTFIRKWKIIITSIDWKHREGNKR